jgi:hypothetical protein
LASSGSASAQRALVFGSVFEAIVTGMLAALFLWFAYLLSRQMRWHND